MENEGARRDDLRRVRPGGAVINPTKKDIGRGVVYQPGYGEPEDGAITSFNASFVFVRYQKQHPGANGQATKREDLYWLSGKDSESPE